MHDTEPVRGLMDVRWIHGSAGDPPIQVHAHDPHTFILRQSKAVHYEAPFLYLFLGDDRALLLDTGATPAPEEFPLRDTIDALLAPGYELVVAHTHAHGDHIAGDPQFADRPATTVVGPDLAAVQAFFGFADRPTEITTFDLGGRVLEITGIPGHHETSVAVFDPWTGFLLTGDTVYPGRLYVSDFPAFLASLDHLVTFAADRPVTHVMGCHIEMSRQPGHDYPIGTTYQPDEPPLPMTVAQLRAVRDAAMSVADRPGIHVFNDFIIYNGAS
jgi:glyoxylase-like metal-dependent hydrolase (beta-lactamase superfamily II)